MSTENNELESLWSQPEETPLNPEYVKNTCNNCGLEYESSKPSKERICGKCRNKIIRKIFELPRITPFAFFGNVSEDTHKSDSPENDPIPKDLKK